MSFQIGQLSTYSLGYTPGAGNKRASDGKNLAMLVSAEPRRRRWLDNAEPRLCPGHKKRTSG